MVWVLLVFLSYQGVQVISEHSTQQECIQALHSAATDSDGVYDTKYATAFECEQRYKI